MILVQSLSKSSVCPKSEITSPAETLLDSDWTNPGFPCPISVQEPLIWTGTLQTLDNLGQGLDRPSTFLLVRQTLDRVWTEIGLRLDLCPIYVQPTIGKEHHILSTGCPI